MSDDDHDYSEPWALFDDEEKPWTNFEKLRKVRELCDKQAEMGDALGCHPSTISNWLQKLDAHEEEQARQSMNPCTRCEDGEVIGKDELCPGCRDELRDRDSQADYDDYYEHLQEIHG